MAQTEFGPSRVVKLRSRHGLQVEGSQVWITGFTRDSRGRLQACVEVASPAPIGVLKPVVDDIDDQDRDG